MSDPTHRPDPDEDVEVVQHDPFPIPSLAEGGLVPIGALCSLGVMFIICTRLVTMGP